MDWKLLATVFATVFVAEIGDKTQLSTMLFAADERGSKWVVFLGASLALIAAAGIGVLVGAQMDRFISPRTLRIVAGTGFILIGAWTILTR